MVSWADGESKQEAEVELYQMEINILSLAGHQYCKTYHFEGFFCLFVFFFSKTEPEGIEMKQK